MTDDRRRLEDIVSAVDDAALIVDRGRAVFDSDQLMIRAAKNLVTEIGEAAKALSLFWDTLLYDLPRLGHQIRAHLEGASD